MSDAQDAGLFTFLERHTSVMPGTSTPDMVAAGRHSYDTRFGSYNMVGESQEVVTRFFLTTYPSQRSGRLS